MNQHKTRVLLWILLLTVCATVLGSCIHPDEGDFYTTPHDIKRPLPPLPTTEQITTEATPPEESTPEVTTSDTIPPEITTPEGTTPGEVTTPEETTEEVTTPEITTPEETTTEQTTPEPPIDPPTPTEKIKIYIDQGHNPFSPTHPPSWNTGASNEALGLYEQDLTYEIGILLAELLAQDDRFEVRLSRPTPETILGTDNDSALDFRINDAEEWGADYFISLHINSFGDPSASGLEFCYATDDITGKELGAVLIDGLAKSTGLRKRDPKPRNDLRVLVNTTMPAVLLEMGFISNWDDATLLDESPELFAQGVYNGIQAYFDAIELSGE